MSKKHMARVAQLPCVLCLRLSGNETRPVCVHHIREGQGRGQKANDYLTIPLCHDCHQGDKGIHGDRTYLYITKTTEMDLLSDTIEMLMGDKHCRN